VPGSRGERTERHLRGVLDQHRIVRRADDRGARRRGELGEERSNRPRVRLVRGAAVGSSASRSSAAQRARAPRRPRCRSPMDRRSTRCCASSSSPTQRAPGSAAVGAPRIASASSTLSCAVRKRHEVGPCVTSPSAHAARGRAAWRRAVRSARRGRAPRPRSADRAPRSRCRSVDSRSRTGPVTATAARLEDERQIGRPARRRSFASGRRFGHDVTRRHGELRLSGGSTFPARAERHLPGCGRRERARRPPSSSSGMRTQPPRLRPLRRLLR